MVPVKSTKEYEQQELVCVLFSETLQRALERSLLSQADVDNYEPALMFTIPRLAIVAGLLAPPGGPLCLNSVDTISEMFRPFRVILISPSSPFIRSVTFIGDTLDPFELSFRNQICI
jgi:hypothetical protein